MQEMHRLLLDSGFNKALLYTADGPAQVPKGSLPELPVVVNFGTGDAKDAFGQLKKLRPDGPFMSGEYWDGWFDHWGERHHTTNVKQTADELAWMLKQGYSVNLYMFHGGTSFGWMNGANYSRGSGYQPDVTSYDYDSPLSESGQPTAKFTALRKVIADATGITPPPVPASPASQTIAPFDLSQSASLWSGLPAARESDHPLTMEEVGQAYGYILYRTTVPLETHGRLALQNLHDYARIYVNGNSVGALDRRHPDELFITAHKGDRLDILVENTGRVNFTKTIRDERVGILGAVLLDGAPLHHWKTFPLPMNDPEKLTFEATSCVGPCFYRGMFTTSVSADTFLDTSRFHKGFVWLNGHPLGRVWDEGPQRALYVPGPWLRQGRNDVVVFDVEGVSTPGLLGLALPILDAPNAKASAARTP